MLTKFLNLWNIIRYSIYIPIYDLIAFRFAPFRKMSLQRVAPQKGNKVLLLGAGTGLDFKYLPHNVDVIATDITPLMVRIQKIRSGKSGKQIHCQVADAQNLPFEAEFFDTVVLHLIFAVVPDPKKMLYEVNRVLKPGGQILVFDKFHQSDKPPSILKKIFGFLTELLFSNINRRVEELATYADGEIVYNKGVWLKGVFRVIELRKTSSQ